MVESDNQLRKANSVLNLREYSAGATVLQSLPQFLILELTQGCNLACEMCRADIISTHKRRMSDEVFRAVEPLFQTAQMVDLRGWGESLILSDIHTRIDQVAQYGAAIRFVTNLAFHKPDVIRHLVEAECYVAVSIDSASPETFRVLRGGANLALVKENLAALTAGNMARRGNADRITLNTTIQAPALHDLETVVDFAADVGVPEIRFAGVTAEGDSPLALNGRDEEVDAAVKKAAERARHRGVRLFASTAVGSLALNDPNQAACLHPWSYAYVAWDGAVGFCDHLIGPDGHPYLLGNITDSSFGAIWNANTWVSLREEHLKLRRKSAPFFKECDWCYKHRYPDFEHLFDARVEERRVSLTRNAAPP